MLRSNRGARPSATQTRRRGTAPRELSPPSARASQAHSKHAQTWPQGSDSESSPGPTSGRKRNRMTACRSEDEEYAPMPQRRQNERTYKKVDCVFRGPIATAMLKSVADEGANGVEHHCQGYCSVQTDQCSRGEDAIFAIPRQSSVPQECICPSGASDASSTKEYWVHGLRPGTLSSGILVRWERPNHF